VLHSAAFRAADIFISTEAHAEAVTALAERFGKSHLCIDVRSDLVAGEWAMLLRQPVWAVVATAEFGHLLKKFFAEVRGIENLRILVLGKDDLSQIPLGAPTYVTHRVREALGVTPIRGRILPPARTISSDSARKLFDFIVQKNYQAQQVLQGPTIPAASRLA
jgi:hypothetical protein